MKSDSLDASEELTVVTTPEPSTQFALSPEAGPDLAPDVAVPVRPQRRRLRLLTEVPVVLVVAGAALGLAIIGLHHFRLGNVAIGCAVLGGGLFRLVLPARQVGVLAVRSRFTDVLTMGVIGGALLVLALVTRT